MLWEGGSGDRFNGTWKVVARSTSTPGVLRMRAAPVVEGYKNEISKLQEVDRLEARVVTKHGVTLDSDVGRAGAWQASALDPIDGQ